jgi:putative transposase
MVENPKLAKSISDAGWGQFFTMLKYKAEWEGKIYIEVDRFFPSSKTCNTCLNRVDSFSLDIRSWPCPKCGENHDRDINAAKNIRIGRFTNFGGRAYRYCFWRESKYRN